MILYCVMLCSLLFCSLQFNSIPFFSILFNMFYSILLYSISNSIYSIVLALPCRATAASAPQAKLDPFHRSRNTTNMVPYSESTYRSIWKGSRSECPGTLSWHHFGLSSSTICILPGRTPRRTSCCIEEPGPPLTWWRVLLQ